MKLFSLTTILLILLLPGTIYATVDFLSANKITKEYYWGDDDNKTGWIGWTNVPESQLDFAENDLKKLGYTRTYYPYKIESFIASFIVILTLGRYIIRRRLKKPLALTIIFLLSILGASGQKKPENITPIPQSKKTLDIPKYENGYPFIYWHYCKQKQTQLGLSSPEISDDSLIFRVWLTVPSTKKNQRQDMAEIRYVNDRWVARVINMRVDLKGKTEEKISNFTITEVSPVAGWNHLIDSLYYYHVESLPTDERLPNYSQLTSNYENRAPTFCFEYATPGVYRFYQYNDPWKLAETYDEATDAANMLHMLNRELHIDSLSTEFRIKLER